MGSRPVLVTKSAFATNFETLQFEPDETAVETYRSTGSVPGWQNLSTSLKVGLDSQSPGSCTALRHKRLLAAVVPVHRDPVPSR